MRQTSIVNFFKKKQNTTSNNVIQKKKNLATPETPKTPAPKVVNIQKRKIIAEISKVKVIAEDITKIKVDAIVNAAKRSLLGGGGVDGAIHRAAGPKLREECRTLNGCQTGEAKITNAYNISTAKAIIHTVGPCVYDTVTEEDEEKLYNCYLNSLIVATENDMRSIAFPAISTGIYGYPKYDAAVIATKAVRNFLKDKEQFDKIDEIIFCVFGEEDEGIYKYLLPKIFKCFKRHSDQQLQ